MNEEIICKKSNRKSSLIESNISWSGDTITTCNLCRMNVWDPEFDKFHLELSINEDDGYHF
jgi:hypothetical protein